MSWVVHPSIPARSVKDLLALARSHPGTLNSASAGVGSSNHLSLVLFNMLSGANVGHVPYKGAAPAVTDVMGGHVAMTFAPIAAVVSPIKAGKLRALAVTAATRSAIFPKLPTISEAGVPGYDASGWNAMLAPKATPRDIIRKIHGAVVESLRAPKVKQILLSAGAELNWVSTWDGLTPLDAAQRSGAEDLVAWLASRGGKPAAAVGGDG